MAGNVLELTDENFESEVINSTIPVLVDFTATWCGPCKALAPIVEGLANEAGGKYKVAKVDIDDASGTASKYRVRSVPTIMIFQGGQVKGQHVGLANKETLLKLIGA
jgi:thioredoxin 1